jgi:hypothetical protein
MPRLNPADLTGGSVGWWMAVGANAWIDLCSNFAHPYVRRFAVSFYLIPPVGSRLFIGPLLLPDVAYILYSVCCSNPNQALSCV